ALEPARGPLAARRPAVAGLVDELVLARLEGPFGPVVRRRLALGTGAGLEAPLGVLELRLGLGPARLLLDPLGPLGGGGLGGPHPAGLARRIRDGRARGALVDRRRGAPARDRRRRRHRMPRRQAL